ncbi:MAG: GumC family protein [Alphaproteobacteria bacterium]
MLHKQSSQRDFATIDFRALRDIFRRQKAVVGGTIVTLIVLSILITSQFIPLYTGQVLLLVDPREARVVNIDEVVSGMPANSATIDSEVEVIKSSRVAIDVIAGLNLLDTKDFTASKSILEWFDEITGLAIGGKNKKPHPTASLVRGLGVFHDRLQVRRRGLTYVIEINFTAQDPQMAADVANALSQAYLRQQTEGKLELNQRAIGLLRKRLLVLSRQLAVSEDAVDAFMRNRVDVTLLGKSSQDFEQAMVLWKNTRQESTQANMHFREVQRRVASGDFLSAAKALDSRGINDLVAMREKLADREGRLRSQISGQGPDLFDLQNQLRALTSRIREEVATANGSLQLRVSRAQERRKAARENVRQLAAKNRRSSGVALELWKLQQNTRATRDLYETFLARLRQTEQLQSVQLADSRVISAALPPIEPSYPPKALIFVLTLLFSTGLGVSIGFTRDYFAQDVHDEFQLEQTVEIPVVASIPAITPMGRAAPGNGFDERVIDMVVDHPMSVFSEAVRRTRIGLELAVQNGHQAGQSKSLSVMVAAAVAGEGKSTLAVLLARSWTQAGKKVALVDFDFRRPSIQRLFGGPPGKDAEPISGQGRNQALPRELMKDPRTAVKYVHAKNFIAPSESETGITERTIGRIIDSLKRRFDIVVIDAPPLLPVIDARLVLPSVDITLFVVRAHSTTHAKIVKALRDVRQGNKPVVAALNAVKSNVMSSSETDPYAHAYE